MSNRRATAVVAALLVVLASLTVSGAAVAADPTPKPTPTPKPKGKPPVSYVVSNGSYFSFPNSSSSRKYAIRNRVLNSINSVWGGPKDSRGLPMKGNGTIRIATWSFNDATIARALVAAKKRGVSVQVVAAREHNKDFRYWRYLKRSLGKALYVPGHPETIDQKSFARDCSGSCRGAGGTPHSKFFLFTNVGNAHVAQISMQSTMNLTSMGFQGQWNEAIVRKDAATYADFANIHRSMAKGAAQSPAYRRYPHPKIGLTDVFFPRPGTTSAGDPLMKALSQVRCTGATGRGSSHGHTKIRVINYAVYDKRGVWLSKRLRQLRGQGCDVRMIYTLMTRPVRAILRGIPLRQSVIKNGRGEIVKYNHSKWMTITGNYAGKRNAYMTFSGSANWSNAAFSNDEQMQEISDYKTAMSHLSNFSATWGQRSSRSPSNRVTVNGRSVPGVPEKAEFGKGAYKFLTANG